MSFSKALNKSNTKDSIPLNADKTITIAAVEIIIPKTDIAEIILITLCDFFENKYFLAMKNGVFT